MRTTFINTLIELAKKDERIFLITPDMGYSVLEKYRDEFPDRFLNSASTAGSGLQSDKCKTSWNWCGINIWFFRNKSSCN